ncbi:MAG: hypothetical protein WC823_04915 [Parcubacteria group bacterium]|jgi:hypothetical protein
MKKIIPLYPLTIAFCLISFNVLAADINGNIEHRNTIIDKKSSQQLNFYGSSLTDGSTLGVSGVASVSKDYSETYLGPIWAPAPWISLEASIGLQQIENGSPLRYAVAGWIGNSIGSLYYTREMGASNEDWWEKFRVFANMGNIAQIGAVYEKGCDWGPIIEIPIASSKFKVRAVWYPKPDVMQLSLFFNF